ncbi:MAG: FliA/WhiG family RNA polymerase sigma factor [Nitrospinae bacterium]|nr:FliA/WhiG family RNA polymerase sigma factor [Nitrospinota bacterium]
MVDLRKSYSEPTPGIKIGTPEADKLIIEYAPLIKFIAQRIAVRLPPHIELDDLTSAGVMGLIDSIKKFDPTKDTQFKTYAEIRIRGAILDELRSLDWVPRSVRQKATELSQAYTSVEQKLGRAASDEDVAKEMGVPIEELHKTIGNVRSAPILSFEELGGTGKDGEKRDIMNILAGSPDSDPQMLARINEVREIIGGAIDELPEKERLLVSLYYYEELTMKEIGEVLGITESRVSQLHTRVVVRLRGKLLKFIHGQDDITD